MRGDHLEWSSDAPHHLPPGAAVPVQVTLLDEPAMPPLGQGERMAAALEHLAHAQSLAGLDAARWQQDTRTDRTLPGQDN